jgi:hypothetical protein
MPGPVVLASHDGFIVAIGPAATLRPAFNGASPVTVEAGEYEGDVVTLRPVHRWRDGAAVDDDVAGTDGDTVSAYIDPDALDRAPKLAATLASWRQQAEQATRARAAAADVWDRWSQNEPPA